MGNDFTSRWIVCSVYNMQQANMHCDVTNVCPTLYQALQKAHSGASSGDQKRHSKLPPRLAKQREQKEKGKQHTKAPTEAPARPSAVVVSTTQQRQAPAAEGQVQQPREPGKTFMPNIENWDNEMANNIPATSNSAAPTSVEVQGARSKFNSVRWCC